ncbi:MAG: hypothetical protein NXY57DRAFT_1078728 [Lentinula lateritia]|nr:MAG: hypothetical protein NXY57DRAFT_1078728 [Lentinula lateritia]
MTLPMLPFDILLLILEYLPLPDATSSRYIRDDTPNNHRQAQNPLYCCSLANRELSQAAGMTVAESSWSNQKGALESRNEEADVRDYGLPAAPHPLLSTLNSTLPINSYMYVQHLHITGYLSTLPPGSSSNRLPMLLADAIHLFTRGSHAKLQSLRFAPEDCHPQTFVQSLEILSDSHREVGSSLCLSELHLNQHAFDDENKTRLLAQVTGLKKITLENPTRVLLQALVSDNRASNDSSDQGWLYRLQADMVELHFLNNCGSITPGVLHSFIPYLSNLERLTLGISYSLADKDVFVALSKLKRLKSISVRWYLQLNSPPPSIFIEEWPLPALEIFQVGYSSRSLRAVLPRDKVRNTSSPHTHIRVSSSSTELDMMSDGSNLSCPLCSWVLKATAGSPALKEVVFVDEDDGDEEDETDDEQSDFDSEIGDGQADVQAQTIKRNMWMLLGGLNLEESIIEEEEEDLDHFLQTDS